MTSLKKLALHGAAWTILGYGASQFIRLVSNLVLTRLLVPELFGLMALVNTFIIGLNLFSDIGIMPSIVQNRRGDDPDFLNTAWTLQSIRGVGLWLACLAISYPVAAFYEDWRIAVLLPVIGLQTIFNGFNATSLATMRRHLQLRGLTILEIALQVISAAFMIIWAMVSPTVWALVAGNLLAAILRLAFSHLFLMKDFHNRFLLDKTAIAELFTVGRWVFINTAMAFLSQQADRLILGKLFTLELLGIYSIAFTFSDIPRAVIGRLSGSVLFPSMSKKADLPREEFREKILKNRMIMLLGGAAVVVGLTSLGDVLIQVLYDDRYRQAEWMLPVLALGMWFRVLFETMAPALKAVGKFQYDAWGSVFRLLLVGAGMPAMYFWVGPIGAVSMVALGDFPNYVVVAIGLWKERLQGFRQDLLASLFFAGLLGGVILIRVALGFGTPLDTLLQS